jgi:hypothetical protein
VADSAGGLRVTAKRAPRRVSLVGPGFLYELAPLGAAWLAGKLMTAALQLIDEPESLGVHARGFAPVLLWTQPERAGGWVFESLTTVQQVQARIVMAQKEGIPYRLTVEMIGDPLQDPTEGKEPPR